MIYVYVYDWSYCFSTTEQSTFVLYRLEEIMNTIPADAGGTMCLLFEITIKGEFCIWDSKYVDMESYPITWWSG